MRYAAILIALWLGLAPGWAYASCRQALVVGMDVSGSVDDAEYRLQLGGLARALSHGAVRAALLQTPDQPVWLAVYDWTAPGDTRMLLPWTEITDAAVLDGIVALLPGIRRQPRNPQTAVGSSMQFGAGLLAARSDCPRQTLDLTGDGMSNTGPLPRDVILAPQITVNALVITEVDAAPPGEEAELTAWFRAEVIRGPDAFAEPARGFADFERAMVWKLLRELNGLQIGAGAGGSLGKG